MEAYTYSQIHRGYYDERQKIGGGKYVLLGEGGAGAGDTEAQLRILAVVKGGPTPPYPPPKHGHCEVDAP